MTDVDKTVRVELENGANGQADAHAGRGHGADVGYSSYCLDFVGASGYCVYGDREKEIANENHT